MTPDELMKQVLDDIDGLEGRCIQMEIYNTKVWVYMTPETRRSAIANLIYDAIQTTRKECSKECMRTTTSTSNGLENYFTDEKWVG